MIFSRGVFLGTGTCTKPCADVPAESVLLCNSFFKMFSWTHEASEISFIATNAALTERVAMLTVAIFSPAFERGVEGLESAGPHVMPLLSNRKLSPSATF
jgi:hypothetical protein